MASKGTSLPEEFDIAKLKCELVILMKRHAITMEKHQAVEQELHAIVQEIRKYERAITTAVLSNELVQHRKEAKEAETDVTTAQIRTHAHEPTDASVRKQDLRMYVVLGTFPDILTWTLSVCETFFSSEDGGITYDDFKPRTRIPPGEHAQLMKYTTVFTTVIRALCAKCKTKAQCIDLIDTIFGREPILIDRTLTKHHQIVHAYLIEIAKRLSVYNAESEIKHFLTMEVMLWMFLAMPYKVTLLAPKWNQPKEGPRIRPKYSWYSTQIKTFRTRNSDDTKRSYKDAALEYLTVMIERARGSADSETKEHDTDASAGAVKPDCGGHPESADSWGDAMVSGGGSGGAEGVGDAGDA